MNRLPAWFRQEFADEATGELAQLLTESSVHTVCQEARCPNINHCFKNKRFTFLILGNTCTRSCRFCAVRKSANKNLALDEDEPYRISRLVERLDLDYVVITSVTRDDLVDGGAAIFVETIELIHKINEDIKVEVLIPDFRGKIKSIETVLNAAPFVVAHNIETIKRLYPDLRPQADYELSLGILRKLKELKPRIFTKSSLMLGLGETEEEVIAAMKDLRSNYCDILTLGQYLVPSPEHYPIKEFISIEQFKEYKDIGMALGFKAVLSGPLVRSSYQAERIFQQAARALAVGTHPRRGLSLLCKLSVNRKMCQKGFYV
jgi:lipoic acid synthetase